MANNSSPEKSAAALRSAAHDPVNDPILRVPDVCRLIGCGRSKIYAMLSTGDFPQAIRIGVNSVGWRKSTVEKWLDERPKVDLRKPSKAKADNVAGIAA